MTKLYISITRDLMDLVEQISHEMGMDAICGYTPSISGGKQVLAHVDHSLLGLCVQDAELLHGRDDVNYCTKEKGNLPVRTEKSGGHQWSFSQQQEENDQGSDELLRSSFKSRVSG